LPHLAHQADVRTTRDRDVGAVSGRGRHLHHGLRGQLHGWHGDWVRRQAVINRFITSLVNELRSSLYEVFHLKHTQTSL